MSVAVLPCWPRIALSGCARATPARVAVPASVAQRRVRREIVGMDILPVWRVLLLRRRGECRETLTGIWRGVHGAEPVRVLLRQPEIGGLGTGAGVSRAKMAES